MALIKCKECGNDISSQAQSCPKCGFQSTNSNWSFMRKLKWGLVLVLVVLLNKTCTNDKPSPAEVSSESDPSTLPLKQEQPTNAPSPTVSSVMPSSSNLPSKQKNQDIPARGVRSSLDACEDTKGFVSGQLRQVYEKLIKPSLKAPTTAKFDNYDAVKNTQNGTICLWTIGADVTSQNSFGAMLTKRYVIDVGCDSEKRVCFQIIADK